MKRIPPETLAEIMVRAKALADTEIEDIEFDPEDLHIDFSKPPPPRLVSAAPAMPATGPCSKRSQRITIRIKSRSLAVIRARAAALRIPYQRYLNQLLSAATASLPE